MKIHTLGIAIAGVIASTAALAAAPADYYNSVDATNAQTLRNSLHEIIDDHTKIPYTSSATDTWDVLEIADQDPSNAGNVIDVYKNASYAKVGGGNTNYNREHSWPKSYGFPTDRSSNLAYTDLHHLFIANSSYNSSRSNKPYAPCDASCSSKPTDNNNNRGGSAQDVNLTTGSGSTGSWQTWPARRGDVARALLYLAVRYEGGMHGVTGNLEPDLILTDDRNLIEASKTGGNESVAYMGLRSTLLAWHHADPVDDFERRRNDAIFQYQGNRNPFIDHPEYVACVFESSCSGLGGGTGGSDTTAPNAPTGLNATSGTGSVSLTWAANTESDLASYSIYRSTNATSGFSQVANTTATSFNDSGLTAGTTYYYQITALDSSNNESAASNTVNGTPSAPASVDVWINEFHYDNSSTDQNEGVEVAGTAGTNLSGWQILAYNGNGGTVYKTVTLSGTIPDQANGFGTLNFAISGLQNGAPDGIALVDNAGLVKQFISYEGTMTATDGAAAGMTSNDVGVSETSSTPVGYAIQLTGTGTKASDFTWTLTNHSRGAVNAGQSFAGGTSTPSEPAPAPVETSFENTQATAIPDNSSMTSLLDVSYTGTASTATVDVNISHTYRGDISLTLVSPAGLQYTLKSKDGRDGADNVIASYAISVSGATQGTWELIARDNYNQDVGTLNSWGITFN